MRIVSIDTMQVPSGNADSSRGSWCPIVVRINTDEGISGFGEVGLAYGKGWRGGLGMVQDFAEQIVGMDPLKDPHMPWPRARLRPSSFGRLYSAILSGEWPVVLL